MEHNRNKTKTFLLLPVLRNSGKSKAANQRQVAKSKYCIFNDWFIVSVCRSSYGSTREVAKLSKCLATSQVDIFVSSFSFFKPIKSLQTCSSKASWRHQRASIRIMEHADVLSKFFTLNCASLLVVL